MKVELYEIEIIQKLEIEINRAEKKVIFAFNRTVGV